MRGQTPRALLLNVILHNGYLFFLWESRSVVCGCFVHVLYVYMKNFLGCFVRS